MNFKVTIVTNVTLYSPHAGLIPLNTNLNCFKGVPLTLHFRFNKPNKAIEELKDKNNVKGLLEEYFRKDKGESIEGFYHILDEAGEPATRRVWINPEQLNVIFNNRARQVLGIEFKILDDLPALQKLKRVELTEDTKTTAVDLLYYHNPNLKAIDTRDGSGNIRVYRLDDNFNILEDDKPAMSPIKLTTYEGNEYPLYVRAVRFGDFLYTFRYYCQRNIVSCGVLNVQGIDRAIYPYDPKRYSKCTDINIFKNIIDGTRATTLVVSSTMDELPLLEASKLLNGVDMVTVGDILNLNSTNRIFTAIVTKQK